MKFFDQSLLQLFTSEASKIKGLIREKIEEGKISLTSIYTNLISISVSYTHLTLPTSDLV